MNSIKEDVINEIIINKSRFIAVLTGVNSKDEVNDKIAYYKNFYKDATHYCTAYIINGSQKCDDDGEPSGTAGMPMLNVLLNNDLTNVLCIVIRYFGGIKLGAGGLVRAYSKSVSEAINKALIVRLVDGYLVEIEFDYENTKFIDHMLRKYEVIKNYDSKIYCVFKISLDEYLEIENFLVEKCNIVKKEPILLTV